ncbi:sentrin-specific protease 7 isoform X2 [Spea bombifrons]|nr:sentrin-specific protease 7 isoform X2 [Spea bombifrons]
MSPLSRLADPDFKNVTTRKRAWCSSYDSFNTTRNKDSCAYYVSKFGSNKPCSLQNWTQPKLILTNVLKTDIGRQYMKAAETPNIDVSGSPKLTPMQLSLFSRQPRIVLTDIRDMGRRSAKNHVTGSNSCIEANSQTCHIPSPTSNDTETCQVLDDPQESMGLSPRNEQNAGFCSEKESYPKKNERCSVYLGKRCVMEQKEEIVQDTPPSKACRDVSNTSASFPKDVNTQKTKKSQKNQSSHKETKPECDDQDKSKKPSSLDITTLEKTYCHKRTEQLNSKAAASQVTCPERSTNKPSCASEDKHIDLSAHEPGNTASSSARSSENPENILNGRTLPNSSVEVSHSSPQGERLCRRKLHMKRSSRESSSSSEPIVLSSDEEEREARENVEAPSTRVIRQTFAEMTMKAKVAPSHRSSPPEAAMHTHVSECPEDQSSKKETELTTEAHRSMLELQFVNVYFGKNVGRATGSVKFSSKSIDIPLKVSSLRSMCLSVDTSKVLRYGLWVKKRAAVRSRAIVFLWLDPDHARELNKQIGANTTIETAKTSEFIFLELTDSPTQIELTLLRETMKESNKDGTSTQGDFLSWAEAYPVLKKLSPGENAFVANCLHEFQKERHQHSNTRTHPEKPEDKGETSIPPTYSLLGRCASGHYSVSLAPKPDNTWKILRTGGSRLNLLVYPPPPTKGGLAVTNEDLECLEHGEFLNDVIIDFYLKYILLEKFPKPFAERCHIFSSFFFKCLTRKDNGASEDSTNLTSAERRHQSVKTWTRHVDIFSKDFIFVPVNENSHWYLVVICFPGLEKPVYEKPRKQASAPLQSQESRNSSSGGSVIVYNDSFAKEKEDTMQDENVDHPHQKSSGTKSLSSDTNSIVDQKCKEPQRDNNGKVCKRPCLLIFDSLITASVQSTVHVLREYLKVEWNVKRKTPREFTRSTIRDLYPKVPKQNNSTDCGLYLLQYVESFYQKPIVDFDHPIHLGDWFPLCVIRSKREEIRDLILHLHFQQRRTS